MISLTCGADPCPVEDETVRKERVCKLWYIFVQLLGEREGMQEQRGKEQERRRRNKRIQIVNNGILHCGVCFRADN